MKLLADSGSTKTSWLLLAGENILQEFETKGMNPFFITEDEVINALEENLRPDVIPNIKHVHFFGAGCSNQEKVEWIHDIIQKTIPNALIDIQTDIDGAVKSVANLGEKSIVSILGTGSSFRIFDGENIVKKYSSLGFIIGDEGSGTHISKALLRKIMYGQCSEFIQFDFYDYYNTNRDIIIETVYTKEFPNKYLANFATFCSRHIATPDIEHIVLDSIEEYIETHILNIPESQNYILHFVGSIAFYFRPQLEKVLKKYNLNLGTVVQKPIHRLAIRLK